MDVMMREKQVESTEDRFKRYQKAEERAQKWFPTLEEAYRYASPLRNDFYIKTQDKNAYDNIYDSTAIDGLRDFSNNIISLLIPPEQRWVQMIPGRTNESRLQLNDQDKALIREALQHENETLFYFINNSTFYQAAFESFQDYGISTGFTLINERPDHPEMPFSVVSIPVSQIFFEINQDRMIENFWRKWTDSVRNLIKRWPDIKQTDEIKTKLSNNPEETITVIEGCIYYPSLVGENKYFYYVQDMTTKKDLWNEKRDYCPFTGFRLNVSPIGSYGEGPILVALPDIRVVNKMGELELKHNDINANPAWLIDSNVVLNTNQIQLNGGDFIVVEPTIGPREPIRPLPQSGNIQFLQLSIERIQQRIRTILFANPLPPPNQGEQPTATEVETRLQDWVRKSGSSIGRMKQEFLNPHMDKFVRILRKYGQLKDINTGRGTLALRYETQEIDFAYASPLLEVQNQKDLQTLNNVIQEFSGIFGAEGITIGFDVAKLPEYIAEKTNIPMKLIRTENAINQLLGNLQQAQQQIQEAQTQGAQAAPQAQTTPLALPSLFNPQAQGASQ